MAEETGRRRVHERWAHLRFSVIGQLLAAPPDKGELKAAIEALAARIWRHPTTGEPVRFGFSTIERWYYRALDENASGEVAPLLAYLRELQRRYGVAVLVVHHAKKGGAGVRAGQALRGSSEFHAWGDSNLYLRRDCDELSLTVEHRAAPSPRPLIIELAQQGLALALEVIERAKPVAAASPSLDERITTVLAEAQEALPFADLRAKCRVRAATLHERIGLLATAGRIVKTADGYQLTER